MVFMMMLIYEMPNYVLYFHTLSTLLRVKKIQLVKWVYEQID